MSNILTPEIRSWIGRTEPEYRAEVTARDIIKYSIATEQRLDKYTQGIEAPPMFLYGLFRPLVPLDELKADGIASASPIPNALPVERIMAGGTQVTHHRTVKPGDKLTGTRTLVDMYEKSGRDGPLVFLVYELEVTTEDGAPVMSELQTRIVR